ncbi:cupin domain-containing protein [Shimia sp. NS0008-38b]|uniref:cupin domain-containing protein n=1 Tax=Shimia sp. NS0008-38b TaxID=3127653 RepID=UPI0031060B2F
MEYPIKSTGPGVTRQVLAENSDLMLVAFRFETGAKGDLHNHPHVQATYVESGRFAFFVEGTEHDLGTGDSLIIPSQANHSCVCLEAGTLIDTFTPRRADFL